MPRCSATHPVPPEIISNILKSVDDDVFLFAVCRRVSRFFRAEIDAIFRTTKLQHTVIIWPTDPDADPTCGFGHQFDCHFSRLSDDHRAAYFQPTRIVNPVWALFSFSVLGHFGDLVKRSSPPPDFVFEKLSNIMRIHEQKLEQHEILCAPLTRIGSDINHLIVSDIHLPGFKTHPDTHEISVDWRALFTAIYSLQHATNSSVAPPATTTSLQRQIPEFWEDKTAVMRNEHYRQLCDTYSPHLQSYISINTCLVVYRRYHPFPKPKTILSEKYHSHHVEYKRMQWLRQTEEDLLRLDTYTTALRLFEFFRNRNMYRVIDAVGQEWWVERNFELSETGYREAA